MITDSYIETWCPKCGHEFSVDAGNEIDGERLVTCPACGAEQLIFVIWKTIKKAFRDSDPELLYENLRSRGV